MISPPWPGPLLDELPNHLDLPAIEQLEQALESFDGTLLLVTRDRRMFPTVRTDRRMFPTVRTGRRWQVEAGQV